MAKRNTKLLTREEKLEHRENVIKLFLAEQINVEEAMHQLKLSRSSVYRICDRYVQGGRQALKHGNQNQPPSNKLDDKQRERILELLEVKYADFQPALAVEYLEREEGIKVSRETVRRLFRQISPSEKTSKGGVPHRLRRRRQRFGELIQIDGSPHRWFGEKRPACCLIAFIDDATSMITDAYFCESENTEAYLHCIEHHLLKYGVPVAFYSDRHSIFDAVIKDYNGESNPTQYQRVCVFFGIDPIRAYSPQAKGRIERLFKTLQNRWPKEFRLKKISSIDKTNAVIEDYIDQHNRSFSLDASALEDAHVKLQSKDFESVRRMCALWHPRKLSKQLTCRFKSSQLQVIAQRRMTLALQPVNIIEYSDGRLELLWIHVEGNRKKHTLLSFRQTTLDQVPEFNVYETSKTVDARLDKIRMSEQTRRINWINRRREAAEKALEEREKEVKAVEQKAEAGRSAE